MEYLYSTLLDDPSELCQWAKEDIEKEYKKSCTKAMKDLSHNVAKREALNQQAIKLAKDLSIAHKHKDDMLVADILYYIHKNVSGELFRSDYGSDIQPRIDSLDF